MSNKQGLSGNIAGAFLQSKLSILLMVAFLLVGIYSTMLIPREEEPQIEVPVADIFIGMPGATPQEMDSRVVAPLEKIIDISNDANPKAAETMANHILQP